MRSNPNRASRSRWATTRVSLSPRWSRSRLPESTGRGVRKLQKRWSGLDSGRREVGGRSAGAFGGTDGGHSGCGEGDGGIGHGKRRSRTGSASLRGRWVGWQVSGGRAPSGWEWNGSQSGQGAAELLLPGPAPGKMQGQSACRAGEARRLHR